METNTAEYLIEESVQTNSTVHVEHTDELEIDLAVECDDYAVTVFGLEYWGESEDGAEWRVHLDVTAD